ncbi:MFS transporter [Pseudomonas sp. NPDC089547]|uniref:MFS transporter n=1 Tax=Pseudomonas sp. NPDC089547 TaxID=3390652 RepID=UPI003CFF2245
MSSIPQSATAKPQAWGAVLAMSLAAFALVASEFMPVSLLTPIASDLQVTEGQAGLGISVSGLFALITSLFIAAIAARMNRRPLLMALTILMITSGSIVALASNYAWFMVGRALIGIAIGGFWSLSAATAMRLVSDEDVPRALAVVNGGNALATVIAAPLGSYLGSLIGWRGAFFCVVPVAALATAWLWISLPNMRTEKVRVSSSPLRLLRDPSIAWGMMAVSIFFMGQFMLFTYLRPFLETVTQVGPEGLSMILLSLGISGLVGTFIIETFIKRAFYGTLIAIPLIMAILVIALITFGKSSIIAATLLALWGLVATAAPVAWWTWLARSLPNDAEAGGGLFVAIVQLAIALGATIGGIVFDIHTYRATFELSALVLILASVLAYITSRQTVKPDVSSPVESNF